MMGLTSEITDEVGFGRRDHQLHLCPHIQLSKFGHVAFSGVDRIRLNTAHQHLWCTVKGASCNANRTCVDSTKGMPK